MDRVADHGGIGGDSEIFPVNDPFGIIAGEITAPRLRECRDLRGAHFPDVERKRPRLAPDCKISSQDPGHLAGLAVFFRYETDVWKGFRIEKIRTPEVLVPFGMIGVDAFRRDVDLHVDLARIQTVMAPDRVEAADDRADSGVTDGEDDGGVVRIDPVHARRVPVTGLVGRSGRGGNSGGGAQKEREGTGESGEKATGYRREILIQGKLLVVGGSK